MKARILGPVLWGFLTESRSADDRKAQTVHGANGGTYRPRGPLALGPGVRVEETDLVGDDEEKDLPSG